MRDQVMPDAKCASCDIDRAVRRDKSVNAVPTPCIAMSLLANAPFQLIFQAGPGTS
jgi:hypothetical protein